MVFISGGPGEAGAPAGTSVPMSLALAQVRDIVLYDQRGTGRSQPALCPAFYDSLEANRNRITNETWVDVRRQFIGPCVESLRAQGIDPEAYNTSVNAHDLADLRRALGYSRWVLRGGSYGTRLAQETMRVAPLGVHGVVLIAPAPPGPENALEWRLTVQRTLGRVFESCAADAACQGRSRIPKVTSTRCTTS